jgi:hypothetical protein
MSGFLSVVVGLVKHSEKFPSVFGGYVIYMNIPLLEKRKDLMPTP